MNRTLGCRGLEDSVGGRRSYREYMNKRALEVAESDNPMEFDSHWAGIRRGWYLGTDQFKVDMLERMDELSGTRESFSGAEIQLHDERKAEELLRQGLDILEIDDESSLLAMSKGSNEKALLAWLVRRHTVVSNAWLAERLQMGRADCLSRYPKRIDETSDTLLVEKRERLREITRLRD